MMSTITTPVLYCPFPPQINPYVDAIEQHTHQWACDQGLIQGPAINERWRADKHGSHAARCHPKGAPERVALASDWFAWTFLFDDYAETELGRCPAELRALTDDYATAASNLATARTTRLDRYGQSFVDLCQRILAMAGPESVKRFLSACQQYFDGIVSEATNRMASRRPTVEEYVRLRALTGTVHSCLVVGEIVNDVVLPDEFRHCRDVQALTTMANNQLCWANDIYSAPKEQAQGDVHNLVLVIQHHNGRSLSEAIDAVVRRHDSEVHRFVALADSLRGSEIGSHIGGYLSMVENCMRGNLDWHSGAARYQTEDR